MLKVKKKERNKMKRFMIGLVIVLGLFFNSTALADSGPRPVWVNGEGPGSEWACYNFNNGTDAGACFRTTSECRAARIAWAESTEGNPSGCYTKTYARVFTYVDKRSDVLYYSAWTLSLSCRLQREEIYDAWWSVLISDCELAE